MLNVTFSDYMRAMLFSGVIFHRREFLNAKNVFRNWPKAILFKFGIINGFVGKLKNGEKVEIRNQWDYYRLLYLHMLEDSRIWGGIIKFRFKNRDLKFYSSNNRGLLDALRVLSETFGMEVYKQLNVKGKIVVDIGSYIGDSPIYFILRGAKRVYALEPYPNSYSLLLKNIEVNGLDGKITGFNEGLSENVGKIRIKEDYRALATSRLKDFHQGGHVKLTTLEEIVERFNLKDACLKMDCEGCEYSILKTPKNALKAFQEIIMEYHYGYNDIKEKLEKVGFQVKNTKPIFYRGDHRLLMGYLHAINMNIA